MRGAALYAALAVPFLLLPLGLEVFGVDAPTGFSVSLIVLIVLGVISAIRVRSIYLMTTEPRSIFFGMLVAAIEIKVIAGAWVGYLVAANLLAPTGIALPVPPQPLRAILSGLVATLVLLSPIYYALSIELERRAAQRELDVEHDAAVERLDEL